MFASALTTLFALAIGSSSPDGDPPTAGKTAVAPELPFKLDRAYKYLWKNKKEKIGETNFQLRQGRGKPGSSAADYLMSTHRRVESNGRLQEAEGTLRFRRDGTPISFREETALTIASQRQFRGQQEVRVQFEKGKATTTYVNNGKIEQASKHEIELARTTYLFSSHCIEQWNLFTPTLARSKPTKIDFLFPDFARVGTLELTPREEPERIRIGGHEVTVTRYDFVARPWSSWKGRIWVDAKGRMLRYESGDLSLVLTTKP